MKAITLILALMILGTVSALWDNSPMFSRDLFRCGPKNGPEDGGSDTGGNGGGENIVGGGGSNVGDGGSNVGGGGSNVGDGGSGSGGGGSVIGGGTIDDVVVSVKSCVSKIGNGLCADANNLAFNYCISSALLSSFSTCQLLAETTDNVIGMGYIAGLLGLGQCLLYYDKTVTGLVSLIDCPLGFLGVLTNLGTGSVESFLPTIGHQCFACAISSVVP